LVSELLEVSKLPLEVEILVIGSINADLIIYPNNQIPGSNYATANKFKFNLGGKGLNQAISVEANGTPVALCGSVGTDIFGKEILEQLKNVGVNINLIRRDENNHTGIGHVKIKQNRDYETVVFNGANDNLINLNFIDMYSPNLKAVIMNFEISVNTIKSASEFYKSKGVKVFINYSPVLPNSEFDFTLADYAVLNLDEAKQILAKNEIDASEAISLLHNLGGNAAVVTDGSNGIFAMDADGKSYFASTPRVTIENTIGAGDTFLAVLTSEVVKENNFQQAITKAAIAASKVCTSTNSYLTKKDKWNE
jgi:ribokinase